MPEQQAGQFERWNTHFSKTVEQEVLGYPFSLAQEPSSHHLGTTVWDASIVAAKWMERVSRQPCLSLSGANDALSGWRHSLRMV